MEEIIKKYNLRRLNASDVFPMSRIFSKIGIDQFKNCFNSSTIRQIIKNDGENKEVIQKSAGLQVFLELANVILANLGNVEKEVFQFLSNISDLSFDEVKNLDITDFIEMIIEFAKKEEFKDFFKAVSKFIK